MINRLVRLSIAAAIGLVAATVNWTLIQSRVASARYVKVDRDYRPGEPFDLDTLSAVEIPAALGSLDETAVPYKDRAVLYSLPAPRALRKGDLVLWRDAVPPLVSLRPKGGEAALAISLEGISVVPRLLKVGDEVGFLIALPRAEPVAAILPPRNATTARPTIPASVAASEADFEYVGPFRILSVGDRTSDLADDGRRALGAQERDISVAITTLKEGNRLDERSRKLVDALRTGRTGGRRVASLVLRPSDRD